MSRTMLHPALFLGERRPYLSAEEALAARIRMVLETRPGQVPWQSDFGCDLAALVGQPATAQRLNEARWRIEEAVRRWVPDAEVLRCHVRVSADGAPMGQRRPRDVPLAESALMSLGKQAVLEVELDVKTDLGPVAVQAVVEP